MDPRIITAVPEQKFEYQAISGVLGVIRAVSVPLGYEGPPNKPNVSSTLWRTVYDQKNIVMCAPVRKLPVAGGKVYSGEASGKFETFEKALF